MALIVRKGFCCAIHWRTTSTKATNPVRVVNVFVEALDLPKRVAVPSTGWRQSVCISPGGMTHMYIYGDLTRIQPLPSPGRHNAIWKLIRLTGSSAADFNLIADLRKDSGTAIAAVRSWFVGCGGA